MRDSGLLLAVLALGAGCAPNPPRSGTPAAADPGGGDTGGGDHQGAGGDPCVPRCDGLCAGAPDHCGGFCPTSSCAGCCDDVATCIAFAAQSGFACGAANSRCAVCQGGAGRCGTSTHSCCVPSCGARVCGDDGCDGSCGSCAIMDECRADGRCAPRPLGFLFGVGEPVIWNTPPPKSWDLDQQIDQMLALSPKVMRMWLSIPACLSDPTTVIESCAVQSEYAIVKLQNAGVTVIGLDHSFPTWMTGQATYGALPCRDLTAGSEYQLFLDRYETAWRTFATRLSTVEVWEPGNEPNLDVFLFPGPCDADLSFTGAEKAAVTTDLMFRSHRAIKTANPDAFVFMPGLAPSDGDGNGGLLAVKTFLTRLYTNIASGQFPSTNPRDYFDGVGWHPYFGGPPTAIEWAAPNNEIYGVMVDHGDAGVPVLFSEYGNHDAGDTGRYRERADRMQRALMLAHTEMPWLWGFVWFRMLDDPYATWGSEAEKSFGILCDPGNGYAWKTSAYTAWSWGADFPIPENTVLSFELARPGDLEGFAATNVDNLASAGGFLWGDATNGDPQLLAPAMQIDAAKVATLEVVATAAAGSAAQIYFMTAAATSFDEANSFWFAINADARPHVYRIATATNANWSGTITRLRVDPSDAAGAIGVDAVRLRGP